MMNPPGDALLMHPPISHWGRPSDHLLRSCSVLPFSQKMVVQGCCPCSHCRVLFFSLAPVTADLLGWFSAIWRYTKSHYSVGHGLGGGGGWSKRARIHLTLPGEAKDGEWGAERGGWGERCLQMRLTSESALFLLFFRFFCIPATPQTLSEVAFAHQRMCLRARSHARAYLSSRFPQCSIRPGGREGERERDQKRVSHPADERVKVKAAPSQKKTSHGFLAHFFFLKSSKRREGNDTLSQSH